jgi:alpha-N-arabinofuranosidase
LPGICNQKCMLNFNRQVARLTKWLLYAVVMVFTRCVPDLPVTSIITVDLEAQTTPVNKRLYGLTVEEINHAIEGGLYAELIQNRSFEDGTLPLHSAYDRKQGVLITPNKWMQPFIPPDSVPGWHRLPNTYLAIDYSLPLHELNKRSLAVSVTANAEVGRGGVVAEGYQGIFLKKGARYDFSFYVRSPSAMPRTLTVALEDSTCTRLLSERFEVTPSYEWKKYRHVFTAAEDVQNAVLTVTAEESAFFYIDVVSLFPQDTWLERPNGLRKDLAENLKALNPQFIRFPGGLFVEGYTNGTFPVWKETVGPISERRHFWNIWGYGSSNGMGYHEYLQLCEDLQAVPVYVINSGVTNQERRPRYEVITEMDKLVQDALDAIAYANGPTDSLLGKLRAKNGHPEPFGLKYIEIGSENYGTEYVKRFKLFKDEIQKAYPEITVISSSPVSEKQRGEWVDSHLYADPDYFISNTTRYRQDRLSLKRTSVFIGEFGVTSAQEAGTLKAAIGKACFLIGAEENPHVVKAIAFAPVLGNADYELVRSPLLTFKKDSLLYSPSYHLLKLFASHRGDLILSTKVDTYSKPFVKPGRASIEVFDNSYEIRDVKLNGAFPEQIETRKGGWESDGQGGLIPAANRWNYVLLGDSTNANYTFSATIQRTKGSDPIQLRIRDNGREGEQRSHIGLTLGDEFCSLYYQSGSMKDTLVAPVRFPFVSHRPYQITLQVEDDHVACRIDGELICEAQLKPLPSLVALATLDEENNQLLLKVVNTTYHEEITELDVRGHRVKHDIEIIELSGNPEDRNTFAQPDRIAPRVKQHSFQIGMLMIYPVPPHSISLIKIKLE